MWYNEIGKDMDVVLSSRIRLARNIDNIRFVNCFSDSEAKKVCELVKMEAKINNLNCLYIKDMDDITLQSLVESYLISHNFISNNNVNSESKMIVVNDKEDLSIMVNEEDHLRIQCLCSGLDFDKLYKQIKDIDNKFSKIGYAYNKEFGYLTSCPTNTGTGMRISAMLHLPGLTGLGYMSELLKDASKFGIAIRGIYGEGTAYENNIYQVSNQITMGISEKETIDRMTAVLKNIVEEERKARQLISKEEDYEDQIYRSYGILKYARKISNKEASRLLFNVKLGIDTGHINDIKIEKLLRIYNNIQVARLQKRLGEKLTTKERDEQRAKYIREELN